jgi:hypothetical protein
MLRIMKTEASNKAHQPDNKRNGWNSLPSFLSESGFAG